MKKEEIIDVLKYIDSENLVVKPSTYADIAESYLSIISTRRSERRADGSNKQAKEFAEKLISNQKDIDPEYVDIVNEHWNELLAND